jgi:tetratricopeptide repeat protein 21B
MSALLAPDALSVQTLINYYARKNLHHHVHTAASQALVKRTNDPVLLFWKGYAVLREGKQADAIRELDLLRGKQGVQLPVLLCLKIAHEGFKLQDREALQSIKEEIFQEEKGNREGSFFLAAMVSMLLGEYKKAREYVTRTIEIMPTAAQAKSLAGWIDLLCGSESKAKKSLALFEEAAEQNPNDVDAQLGRSAYYAQHRDVDRAIDVMNEVMIKNQWFTPAVTEKAHLLFAIADWDQVSPRLPSIRP